MDGRFKVVRADGARFVRHRATRRDVLMVDGFDSDGLPSRLCSQRFYDDCAGMLQPDGILVVNLHCGHARLHIFLDRIRRSYRDSVFIVDGVDDANSIVFAGRGRVFDNRSPGVVRRPKNLDRRAGEQLLGGFAQIKSALGERRRQLLFPVNRIS